MPSHLISAVLPCNAFFNLCRIGTSTLLLSGGCISLDGGSSVGIFTIRTINSVSTYVSASKIRTRLLALFVVWEQLLVRPFIVFAQLFPLCSYFVLGHWTWVEAFFYFNLVCLLLWHEPSPPFQTSGRCSWRHQFLFFTGTHLLFLPVLYFFYQILTQRFYCQYMRHLHYNLNKPQDTARHKSAQNNQLCTQTYKHLTGINHRSPFKEIV